MFSFIAQRSKPRAFLKLTATLILTISFLFNSFTATVLAADYVNLTVQNEVIKNTPFGISLDISAKSNTTYFLKGRLGNVKNQLNKGQTEDYATGIWLSDSVSWERFPSFQTDGQGHWSGKVNLKTATTAITGENFLVVRIKNLADNSLTDSAVYNIVVKDQVATPPAPTVTLTAKPILNEFMPNPPAGGKEWVEIKNSGSGKADLSGWKVDDEPGKSSPEVLPTNTIIEPDGFLVVTFSSPKLNDLTDTVRLLRPDDSVVESYTYTSTEKGKSFAKDKNGNWFISQSPSPNAENPEPLVVSTKAVQKPTVVTPKTNSTQETLISTVSAANNLSQVKGLATKSASFAAAVDNLGENGKFKWSFTLPLVILGCLTLLTSLIFVFKKRSGRPKIVGEPPKIPVTDS